MKFFRYIRYGIRDTRRSLWRHKEMSFLSVLMVFITMVVLGTVLLLAANGYFLSQKLEGELEVSVFLKPDITAEQRDAVGKQIEGLDGVKSVEFVSKDEAYKKLKEQFSDEATDISEVGNPLPDAYTVHFSNAKYIRSTAAEIKTFQGVDSVNSGDKEVTNILSFNRTFAYLIVGFLVMMIFIVILLINGTIKLTVLSRKEEIEIMKYIGATNFSVKFPFFLEGILIGITGSLLAVLALFYGYDEIVSYIKGNLAFFPVFDDTVLTLYLYGGLLLFGIIMGALGSSLAVRKYLRV